MKDVHELEVYACIEGYPNYLVTSKGRVISLNYHREEKLKEIKQSKDKGGYLFIRLYKNGKMYNKKVHRLVAQAFIPNPNNKPQVNHIDENKTNNHVANLEWVTAKDNCNHGSRNERRAKSQSKKVMAKSLTGNKVIIFNSINSADKYGFFHNHIIKCCKGEIKQYKGYTWQYIDNKNEDLK